MVIFFGLEKIQLFSYDVSQSYLNEGEAPIVRIIITSTLDLNESTASLLREFNKTGTSEVGAISKAQKHSRNNYWKHLDKKFFSKKVFFKKKSHNAEKLKKRLFRNRNLTKMQGGTF